MKIIWLSSVIISLVGISCEYNQENSIESKAKKPNYFIDMNKPDNVWLQNNIPKIDSFFINYLDSSRFNGQFLVAKNGHVIYEKFLGYSNVKDGKKMTSETPIHVASVSKFITSVATLKLVQDNKLRLDDDVKKYLKNFPYDGITIRMLLNHRSGIPYYAYFSESIWDKSKKMKNADILDLLVNNDIKLNYPPNTHFSYCNTNYALLALIIEKASQYSFPDAIKSLVFDPLGMKNSFIRDMKKDINLPKNAALSYNSKFLYQEDNFLDGVYGDKNLYTTSHDLLLLDKALYPNLFLNKKSKDEIFKGYSYENVGKNNYGLGIRMMEEADKSKYFFHSGWWHGNTAMFSMLRADTITIIALSNRFTKSVYTVNRLASYFGNYPFDYTEE